MSKYLIKLVFSLVMLTNPYRILPLFSSSVSSVRPPLPVDTTFSAFEWPSYPNKALEQFQKKHHIRRKWYMIHIKKVRGWKQCLPIGVGFSVNYIFPCIHNVVSIFIQIHWHLGASLRAPQANWETPLKQYENHKGRTEKIPQWNVTSKKKCSYIYRVKSLSLLAVFVTHW